MTSGALWCRKMEHQTRGCGVTPDTGLLAGTQSSAFHQAEHELMNLLCMGANELGFCPSCNGNLSREGLRGWEELELV